MKGARYVFRVLMFPNRPPRSREIHLSYPEVRIIVARLNLFPKTLESDLLLWRPAPFLSDLAPDSADS